MSGPISKLNETETFAPFLLDSDEVQTIWSAVWMDVPATMASELTRFAAQRLRAQSDFLARLGRSRTYTDVLEAQTAFWRAAAQDYTAETGKMMGELAVGHAA
ncbi:phasin family protein [Labrys monachus]|uniref:Phasin domain-containing protein n=1 Tax=Labrys monachus TaxID=217067 RepID=A0ABU0F958_9HYPH|nr:phasin family protein [Labrys monachus]MDQ0391149.1 hypothetical protein [Labrys monachus]